MAQATQDIPNLDQSWKEWFSSSLKKTTAITSKKTHPPLKGRIAIDHPYPVIREITERNFIPNMVHQFLSITQMIWVVKIGRNKMGIMI